MMHRAPTTIRSAMAARGRRLHNLWYVHSYLSDSVCILPSDAALFHFALLEGDPKVLKYELEAPSLETTINGEAVGTRFDAQVFLKDGTEEWHEVKADKTLNEVDNSSQLKAQRLLAEQHGVQYRLFTLKELNSQIVRIWNVLRMLQVIHAAHKLELASARTVAVSHLLLGPLPLGEFRSIHQADEGINLAAVFSLLLDGAVTADIDSAPINDWSLITRVGGDDA